MVHLTRGLQVTFLTFLPGKVLVNLAIRSYERGHNPIAGRMSLSSQQPAGAVAAQAAFPSTHWGVVLAAGDSSTAVSRDALELLCRSYWYPLYVFARRQGQTPEDAQDLVQGFFARVLEKGYFNDADRDRGRFRTFLLLALKRFMANEWKRTNRQKRGGGVEIVSLDEAASETRYQAEPVDPMTPERAFDRRWAMTLLQLVSERLRAEFSTGGRADVFEELKVFVSGEQSTLTYAEIGQRLGLTEGTVKVTVHRLRQRYRQLLRLEIAQTVQSPEAVEDELRDLFAALS